MGRRGLMLLINQISNSYRVAEHLQPGHSRSHKDE